MGGHGDRVADGVGAESRDSVTKGKEWPADGRSLGQRLNRVKSALRPAGIEITRGEGRKRRHVFISRRPLSGNGKEGPADRPVGPGPNPGERLADAYSEAANKYRRATDGK